VSPRVLVLNGPNLGTLGRRQPEVYGTTTLAQIRETMETRAAELGVEVRFEQSNHEGTLIDILEQEAGRADGCVINPAGLSHTSVALLDALLAFAAPVVEVHISNLAEREDFRRQSLTAWAARRVISGLGARGYVVALEALLDILTTQENTA